jgi:hypothetical protein
MIPAFLNLLNSGLRWASLLYVDASVADGQDDDFWPRAEPGSGRGEGIPGKEDRPDEVGGGRDSGDRGDDRGEGESREAPRDRRRRRRRRRSNQRPQRRRGAAARRVRVRHHDQYHPDNPTVDAIGAAGYQGGFIHAGRQLPGDEDAWDGGIVQFLRRPHRVRHDDDGGGDSQHEHGDNNDDNDDAGVTVDDCDNKVPEGSYSPSLQTESDFFDDGDEMYGSD